MFLNGWFFYTNKNYCNFAGFVRSALRLFVLLHPKIWGCTRSSMDRIPDSGSDDMSSILIGCTKKGMCFLGTFPFLFFSPQSTRSTTEDFIELWIMSSFSPQRRCPPFGDFGYAGWMRSPSRWFRSAKTHGHKGRVFGIDHDVLLYFKAPFGRFHPAGWWNEWGCPGDGATPYKA